MSYDLKTACQNIHEYQRRFAFYHGTKANEVFITERALEKRYVDEAKATCGDLTLEGKGFCYWGVKGEEIDKLVFVAKNPKPKWEFDLTNIFRKHQFATVPKVLVRLLADNESEEPAEPAAPASNSAPQRPAPQPPARPPRPAPAASTSSPAPAGSSAPAADHAVEQIQQVAERLKPQIVAGLQKHPEEKERVTRLLSSYRKSLDEHHLREAGESLRDLGILLHEWDEGSSSAGGTVEEILAEQRPRPLPKESVEAEFGPERIRDLRDQTNRGFLKGRGDFGDVLKGAEAFYEAVEKAEKGERSQKSLRKKGANDNVYLAGKLQSFIEEAEKYVSKFDDENVAVKRGFFRTRKRATSGIRDTKLEACRELLEAAKTLQAQYKNAATFDLLDDLQKKNAEGGLSGEEEATYHGALATVFANSFGWEKVGGGSSEVSLIKGSNDGVAYAFKSLDGESEQTGMAKGSAGLREALVSTVSSTIFAQTKIDFGFPKTNIVSFGGKKGALIEGINGQVIERPEGEEFDREVGRRAHEEGVEEGVVYARFLDEAKRVSDSAPPVELQKVLLFNFLSGQPDIKWENIMWQEDEDGMIARPFDGGAGFPSVAMMKDYRQKVGTGSTAIGGPLLVNAVDQSLDHPAAIAPMDPDLAKAILDIDVKVLEKSVRDECRRLVQANPEFKGKFDDSCFFIWRAGVVAIQEALRRDPRMSMRDLVNEYNHAFNQAIDSYK